MKLRTVLLTLLLLIVAAPLLWAGSVARPYLGPTPRGPCSAQDIAAVRHIQDRYGLDREYAFHLIRAEFPLEQSEQTLGRSLKDAVRQTLLTKVRSKAYRAAAFCNRTGGSDGPDTVASIPKIAALLTSVDATDGRYRLAVCASLEGVNLRHPPQAISDRCDRAAAIWDRRRIARARIATQPAP